MALLSKSFKPLALVLVRDEFSSKSILGKLYFSLDGDSTMEYLCDTLEPASPRCIKPGTYTYRVIKTPSWSRFYGKPGYARQIRIDDKNGRKGVLFHIGNHPSDTLGCILVGHRVNGLPDYVSDSRHIYANMVSALQNLTGVLNPVGSLIVKSK